MSNNQFDYAAAWREVARPAYDSLPQDIRDLLAQVAGEAASLSQLPDLSMPWPDDPQLGEKRIEGSDLRSRFDKVPAEWLAQAARVIYSCGHWFPAGGDLDLPGREHGAHWKFSHYADQSLRARLIAATSADVMRSNGPFQVHEGAIRLCYSSHDMWTWAEVAPATLEGLTRAKALSLKLSQRLATVPSRHVHERDNAAYKYFEELKSRDLDWPASWKPFVQIGDRYMRDAQEIRQADLTRKGSANRMNVRNAIIRDTEKRIAKLERERDGKVWIVMNGLDLDNVIYYDHQNGGRGVFCFGWQAPVTAKIADQILSVISEFPWAYRIKCADGRELEGGIG